MRKKKDERTGGRFDHGHPPAVVTVRDKEAIRSGILVANSREGKKKKVEKNKVSSKTSFPLLTLIQIFPNMNRQGRGLRSYL